jgi:hypothetical protein
VFKRNKKQDKKTQIYIVMKKQIVIAALALGAIVLGTNTIQAQATTPSTTVNIKLADVISIDAGSVATNGIVGFNYATSTDYNSPQNVTVANSLIVTSSNNFNVKVKAEGANFMNGSNVIPVDVLQVKAVTAGGTMVGTFKTIALSAADQELVSNATLGAKKSLSIDYSISADKASTVLLGKEPGTYTQKVIYTATAI